MCKRRHDGDGRRDGCCQRADESSGGGNSGPQTPSVKLVNMENWKICELSISQKMTC